jgi:phosphatidylserine/phosphatidylglycerophosphate/cardiolipin synthase-like enzyme
MIALGVRRPAVASVADSTYSDVVLQLIRSAHRRCLCSLFIVDIDPRHDRDLKVFALLKELQAAGWRGVDVRLLIGGSRTNLEIAESANAARDVAASLAIRTRWLTSRPNRGSHAKMVVVDDRLILGSHNWSGGAFADQRQDSIALESPGLAEYLAAVFERQWQRASSEN